MGSVRYDKKLGEDWIQCCAKDCGVWCHELCGEKRGILDDKEFFCAECTQKLIRD